MNAKHAVSAGRDERHGKDFSNPRKLGFMRLIQLVFILNVSAGIAGLVVLIKAARADLGFWDYSNMVNVVLDGVALWLIWERQRLARPFIIAVSVANIAVSVVYNLVTGQFDMVTQLLVWSFWDIVLLLYFLTSRRAKAVLTEGFETERDLEVQAADAKLYRPRRWAFWRNIIMYFCVFSVVGHWMEAGYCTFIRFGIIPGTYDPNSQIWSDWLYPFCVYGFGAVACVLLLYPMKTLLQRVLPGRFLPLAGSFCANAFVCTAIEFAMGMMLNQPGPDGKLPLWDYSNMAFNFMGQVCLQNAVAFGVVATLMTWVIYPALERLIAKLPKDGVNMLFVIIVVGFCMLFFLYCVNILIPGFDYAAAGFSNPVAE